jgi:hypothetical protein
METFVPDHYTSLEKALEKAGFGVQEVEKYGKRTVITVFRDGQIRGNSVSPEPGRRIRSNG